MRLFAVVALALLASLADAAVGVTEIAGMDGDEPVTIFYPSQIEAQSVTRGPFTLQLALDAAPAPGNRRLVVISHGSGGAPWVHADLARVLVEAGFMVAAPLHKGDNYKDSSMLGPESWKRRPAELSRAVDMVGRAPRFAPLLALDKVGVYGMSAGGHTALSVAGGRWSPAALRQHCEADIGEDFQACVGLATTLKGNWLDGWKKSIALAVIRYRFEDAQWYSYQDPRFAAVVAAVPYAADFDMASLAKPRVPLALVTARQDKWLVPRFHSDAVLAACTPCERLADFRTGGHGAGLSPLPPKMSRLVGEMLNDPPGFDRAEVAEVNRKTAAFFLKNLLP
jgi:predicted dienelactone hydrolase